MPMPSGGGVTPPGVKRRSSGAAGGECVYVVRGERRTCAPGRIVSWWRPYVECYYGLSGAQHGYELSNVLTGRIFVGPTTRISRGGCYRDVPYLRLAFADIHNRMTLTKLRGHVFNEQLSMIIYPGLSVGRVSKSGEARNGSERGKLPGEREPRTPPHLVAAT